MTSPTRDIRTLENFLVSLPQVPLGTFPTPLICLDRLSRDLNIDLWMKRDDCTGLALGGNKARKLEFILAQAQLKGHDTVVTTGPITSNHTMMTAVAGRQVGIKVHCVIGGTRPKEVTGNLLLLDYLGASLHFSPMNFAQPSIIDFRLLQKSCQDVVKQTKGYWIPAGGSMPEAEPGYMKAVLEISKQREGNFNFDYVVLAIGTGSTTTGVLLGLALASIKSRVLAVSVGSRHAAKNIYKRPTPEALFLKSAEHFNLPLNTKNIPAHNIVFGFAEEGYGIPNSKSDRAIRLMAEREGYFLDPVYTSKAFGGLLTMVENGRIPAGSRVLFIHTGGLSMIASPEKRYSAPTNLSKVYNVTRNSLGT